MLKFIQNCEKIKGLVESNNVDGLKSVHDELMRAPIEEALNTILYLRDNYSEEYNGIARVDKEIFRRCVSIGKYLWPIFRDKNSSNSDNSDIFKFFPDDYNNPVTGEVEHFSEEQCLENTHELNFSQKI